MKPVALCVLAVFAAGLLGCATQFATDGAPKDCAGASRGYFLVDANEPSGSGMLEGALCKLYADQLRSMRQAPLWKKTDSTDAQVYRLLVVPHHYAPYVIRLERMSGGGWRLLERALNEKTGYGQVRDRPNRLSFMTSRVLTPDEAATAEAALAALDVDRMIVDPVFVHRDRETGEEVHYMAIHPTFLVFETVRDGRYHMFTRFWLNAFIESEFERVVQVLHELSVYARKALSSGRTRD